MLKQSLFHRLFTAYARGPEHPMKRRLIGWVVGALKGRKVRAWCGFGWMDLDLRDLIQFSLFMNGAFEPTTRARVEAQLRPGDLFVDVGANVGIFSIMAANNGAQVVALEPNPSICAELLANRAVNGLDVPLRVVSVAADERVDIVPFGVPCAANRGTSRQVETEAGDTVHAPTMPLASICARLGEEKIRLVKIDVEGAELRVLRGLLEGPSALRPEAIVFEYLPDHFQYAETPHGLIDYLEAAGYVVETLNGAPYDRRGPIEESNLWARLRLNTECA
jgi:FkbM family methyltransferase